MHVNVEVVANTTDRLGECPLWCERTSRLYWVDSRAPCIYSVDSSGLQCERWETPELIGSIALSADGTMLAAMQSGVFRVDMASGRTVPFASIEANAPENRLNDGRVDRDGRFWVGSMCDTKREPLGALYCLTTAGDAVKKLEGIIVPNSLAWSPDGCTMYFADTYRNTIWAFAFDRAAGTLSARRLFQDTTDRPGRPDGSAIDEDGCLWNAEYGGGRVVRYTPNGDIDRVLEVPVSNPTCCTFGGADLGTLYITSASQRLNPEQLRQQPLAGALFAAQPGVRGLPESRFAA